MNRGASGLLHPQKYALLMVLLLVVVALQTIDLGTGARSVLSDTAATVVGVVTFLVVFGHPQAHKSVAALLVAVLLTGWARHTLAPRFDYALAICYHLLLAIYLWFAVWTILRALFRTHVPGADNVRGAVCGYLIAGSAWGSVNALGYLLAPAAYGIDPSVVPLLADWHGRTALFSYYSFTQLITIGYANVTPLRAPATTLALFAALFGVFYTAVVVSQLVGMAASSREPKG